MIAGRAVRVLMRSANSTVMLCDIREFPTPGRESTNPALGSFRIEMLTPVGYDDDVTKYIPLEVTDE